MSSVSALRSPLLASPIRKPSSTAGNSIPTTTVRYHRGGQSHALLGSLTVGHRNPNSITGGGAGGLRKIQCSSALNPELKATLDKFVTSQNVILFMKGTKDFPQCGFSNTVVQILKSLNVPFETINILDNDILRQALKEYSQWPTFPQLYIDGEFFGGCDITVEAYKSGQLQELLEKAQCS